ncbi:ABC transporter substrate-binding protein [Streptomyces sp. HSW2009]|uniref:ABC transporter substrate-binding protein n=1 Tax=Streptomyces sp. HSW2009 TaxID=3142890 RepID=UPI0032EB0E1B
MNDPLAEHIATHLGAAFGPTHTGEGHQFNIIQAALSQAEERIDTPRQTIAEDDLGWLSRCFVYPDQFRQARELLRSQGLVLLTGQPGSGRRAAALVLLHELAGAAGSFHELPDTSDSEDGAALDPRMIGRGDRMLLDLSGSDETWYVKVQQELSPFRAQLREQDARLAVVLPHHLGYLRESSHRQLTVHLGRPDARSVLMRHLRHHGIVPDLADLGSTELTEYLVYAPARDLAGLADLMRRERDAHPDAPYGIGDWRDRALAGITDHTPEVARFVVALTGRQRAVALALAMLHERSPEVVHEATTHLLSIVDHAGDERPRFDRTDLTEEFRAVRAQHRSDGTVRFDTPTYAKAVRTHFWTYFPDLRPSFQEWVSRCARSRRFDNTARAALVASFAEQSLRADRPDDLWELADRWCRSPDAARLIPDATQALAEGLRHDRHGQAFRRKVYEWSRESRLPSAFRYVLVTACTKVVAERHPSQALVRLHYLARQERTTRDRLALSGLLALATREGRHCRYLLDRLRPDAWPADAEIFLALAEAASQTPALYTEPATRARLGTGWAAVFEHGAYDRWRVFVSRWLSAALAADAYGAPLLDVLVGAAASRPGPLSRLHVIARDWAAAPGAGRSEVARLLADKIDAAQGIDSPAFAL